MIPPQTPPPHGRVHSIFPEKLCGRARHSRFRVLDLCIRFGKMISKICEGFNLGAVARLAVELLDRMILG